MDRVRRRAHRPARAHQKLWAAARRELAAAAGVSVGLAHETVTRLRETGMDRDELRPALPGLLDRWAIASASSLSKRLTLAQYRGDVDAIWNIRAAGDVYISGETAATEQLRPASAVLYVQQHDPTLAIANRWRTGGFANITVRRKFWYPEEGHSSTPQVHPAPWPLVYADLSNSDDPRVRDSAAKWKDRFADAAKNSRRPIR